MAKVTESTNNSTALKPDTDDNDDNRQDPATEKGDNSTRRILSLAEVEALTQVQDDDSEIGANALYRSGIAALRSSAHRVKAKNRKHNPKPKTKSGQESKTTRLPDPLYEEEVFGFNMETYNLRKLFTAILKKLDPELVGTFRDDNEVLEDFTLPTNTLHRKVNGGCCESTQAYMSEAVAKDEEFLHAFDRMVEEVVVPHMKRRLIDAGAASEEEPLSFYIQRPPTLRLQPGPGRVGVKPHHDGEYGHQNGELNFWLPLTDRNLNGVDLWCESSFQKSDYRPIVAQMGEIISFHGTSCRHFVNRNNSDKTRMSMDFRIGVEGFFDPYWQMNGTTDDHGRREVKF